MPRLENWYVYNLSGPYTPPEGRDVCVGGEVYDREGWEDGERILTSRIVKAEGKIVTTKSGTNYELGKVDEEYKKWCEQQGIELNEENPVHFV